MADSVNNLIFVSNSRGGLVTVINGANNTVGARFYPGMSTPHAMAVDPGRYRLYITPLFYSPSDGPDYMTVFSELSGTEIARRTAMAGPNGIAVRTVNGNTYVAQNYSDNNQWRVAVVNALNMEFVVPFPGILVNGRGLMGTVYSPGSDRVYVNGYNSNTVDVIDAASNTLLTTLGVGANPASGIAVNPNTGRVTSLTAAAARSALSRISRSGRRPHRRWLLHPQLRPRLPAIAIPTSPMTAQHRPAGSTRAESSRTITSAPPPIRIG